MLKRKSQQREEEGANHKRRRNKLHPNGRKDNDRLQSPDEVESGRKNISPSNEGWNRNIPQIVEKGGKRYGVDDNSKLTKLVKALDDVVLLESGIIDENTLSISRELQKSLRKRINRITPETISSSSTTQLPTPHISLQEHHLEIPPSHLITPWNSSCIYQSLPSLPPVTSPELEEAAFTHVGMLCSDGKLSYERLEWVGDAYVYLISTLLISSTFTERTPGGCSVIREMLVKNQTLASYARQYGFEKRARLPREFYEVESTDYKGKYPMREKVMGDIFEAYVAAVILSDPENGVDRAISWLKALWAKTISKEIRDQELRNEQKSKLSAVGDSSLINAKNTLGRKLLSRGIKLNYQEAGPQTKDHRTGMLVFTMAVYLDGWGETNKLLGIGRGPGKKEAGMKAAEDALQKPNLLSKYEGMKKVYDEKRRLEKEEEERAAQVGAVEDSGHSDQLRQEG